MQEIAVFNYYDGSVWVYNLPQVSMTDIEDWLESMDLDDIEYIINPNITINDERKQKDNRTDSRCLN